MEQPRSSSSIALLLVGISAVIALLGCTNEATISEPVTADAPDCAAACLDAPSPTAADIDCMRDACAPVGEPLSAGVTWRGLGADDGDPAVRRDDLTTGEQSTLVPVARFMVRAVSTDALYPSLVDAWFRCRNRVFHRAESPEDWQIRFYTPQRGLLAKWSWLDHRVVFFGSVEAGADDRGRAVWELPSELNPDSPNYLSPSEAEAMMHDLLTVDVCGE